MAVGAIALTVTSGGGASASTSIPLSNSFGYKYGYAAAVAELPKLYAGTNTAVNTTSRPAAKNKSVFIISAGQASISSSIPADAAMAAAQAIGWKATILDGKLEPSTYGGLVDQAIADGANGIILDAIDCDQVKAPLEQAKAKHIAVVPIYAYDCNDPTEDAGPPLFSAVVNTDNIPDKKLGAFAESYGRGQADYVIAKSKNKARVLVLNDPEFTVLKYTAAGFDDQIAHSGGSKVVATLNFLGGRPRAPSCSRRSRPSCSSTRASTGSRARTPTPPSWASCPPWPANPRASTTSWAAKASSPSWRTSQPGRSRPPWPSAPSGSAGPPSTP